MDALELQAALVKLDPATTVTPIGSNVKIVPPHHRIAFAVDLDENNLTLDNAPQNEEKLAGAAVAQANPGRKLHSKCSANLTVPSHQNHQNSQQIGVSKCNVAEVR